MEHQQHSPAGNASGVKRGSSDELENAQRHLKACVERMALLGGTRWQELTKRGKDLLNQLHNSFMETDYLEAPYWGAFSELVHFQTRLHETMAQKKRDKLHELRSQVLHDLESVVEEMHKNMEDARRYCNSIGEDSTSTIPALMNELILMHERDLNLKRLIVDNFEPDKPIPRKVDSSSLSSKLMELVSPTSTLETLVAYITTWTVAPDRDEFRLDEITRTMESNLILLQSAIDEKRKSIVPASHSPPPSSSSSAPAAFTPPFRPKMTYR